MFEEKITKQFLRSLEQIEYGKVHLTMPDGKQYHFSGVKPSYEIKVIIHDIRAIKDFATKGDVGVALAYKNGWFETPDIFQFLSLAVQNHKALETYINGGFMAKIFAMMLYFFRTNTLKGSEKNIHAHYDLGNDFYQLWLDETMTYSSAIFEKEGENLPNAQNNKYDRILEAFNHKPQNLLEIGCGWGGFANRALTQTDTAIKAITISERQHDFAKNRLSSFGKQVEIVKEDYRLQQGQYQSIVSIEMFEAVGEKYWPTYFQKIKSLLAQKGKAVIQTIHIADEEFERYRKSGDMIRTFIFPGGMLPSRYQFTKHAKAAGLKVVDEFNFGMDYFHTLNAWLHNFNQQLPNIKKLNFDEPFIRIWQFYLAFCMVGFFHQKTDVSQFHLEHA